VYIINRKGGQKKTPGIVEEETKPRNHTLSKIPPTPPKAPEIRFSQRSKKKRAKVLANEPDRSSSEFQNHMIPTTNPTTIPKQLPRISFRIEQIPEVPTALGPRTPGNDLALECWCSWSGRWRRGNNGDEELSGVGLRGIGNSVVSFWIAGGWFVESVGGGDCSADLQTGCRVKVSTGSVGMPSKDLKRDSGNRRISTAGCDWFGYICPLQQPGI
jgi:hypothetical protein